MLEQFYMDSYSNPGFTYTQRKHTHHFFFVAAVHAIAICAVLWGTANSEAVYMFNQSGSLLVDNVAVLPTPKPQPPVTPKVKRDTVQKPEVEIERKSADSIELKATNETPAQQQDPTNSAQTVQKKLDAAMICPTQVKPEIPRQALVNGIQGLIRVEAVVQDGAVKDVHFLSGPRIYYPSIRAAMMQYKCSYKSSPVVAMQEFNFHFE